MKKSNLKHTTKPLTIRIFKNQKLLFKNQFNEFKNTLNNNFLTWIFLNKTHSST